MIALGSVLSWVGFLTEELRYDPLRHLRTDVVKVPRVFVGGRKRVGHLWDQRGFSLGSAYYFLICAFSLV